MTSVLVHPESVTPAVSKVLDMLGVMWKGVDDTTAAEVSEPAGGWGGAIVAIDDDPERAFGMARWLQSRDQADTPVLMLTTAEMLPELGDHTNLFDDFCLTPFHPAELEARLDHLLMRSDDGDDAVITYGPLSLNVETYQAMIDGRTLDLTYMEYELLRYLTAAPGKVFSREILLSEVWGYDYYGGARTVDVHIRRLRSKLGEEHASLISTVRSVGYRLGQAKWTS